VGEMDVEDTERYGQGRRRRFGWGGGCFGRGFTVWKQLEVFERMGEEAILRDRWYWFTFFQIAKGLAGGAGRYTPTFPLSK